MLVGGVGGAKLALGLARLLPPERLKIIVNVADDFWHYGLRICPDNDTILYTLGGQVDPVNGWGIADDSLTVMDALRNRGEAPWFRLGDRDLATHLMRTSWLRDGQRLTEITTQLAASLGVMHSVLPVTDDEVATIVDTVEYGELDFQSYFVKHRWQPTVRGIRYAGIKSARMTSEVEKALHEADAVLFGPSNPWLSIGPILAVPNFHETLISRNIPRVAVTPIVGKDVVKGPAAKIMRELNYAVSSQTVTSFYGDAINAFVEDSRGESVMPTEIRTLKCDTMMTTEQHKIDFARTILKWLDDWN